MIQFLPKTISDLDIESLVSVIDLANFLNDSQLLSIAQQVCAKACVKNPIMFSTSKKLAELPAEMSTIVGNNIIKQYPEVMNYFFNRVTMASSCFAQHAGAVRSGAVARAGNLIATGSDDHIVKLTDLVSGQRWDLANHTGSVKVVQFNHDGSMLISAGKDGKAIIWDCSSGKCIRQLEHHASIHTAAFDRLGHYVVTGAGNDIYLWDIASGNCIKILIGHSAKVLSVRFNSAGTHILSASRDGSIGLWDIQAGHLRIMVVEEGGFCGAWFNHKEDTIICVSASGSIKMIDVESRTCLHSYVGHEPRIYAAALNRNGTLIASAGADGKMRILDVETNKSFECDAHAGKAYSVAFNRAGTIVMSTHEHSKVYQWNLYSYLQLKRDLFKHLRAEQVLLLVLLLNRPSHKRRLLLIQDHELEAIFNSLPQRLGQIILNDESFFDTYDAKRRRRNMH